MCGVSVSMRATMCVCVEGRGGGGGGNAAANAPPPQRLGPMPLRVRVLMPLPPTRSEPRATAPVVGCAVNTHAARALRRSQPWALLPHTARDGGTNCASVARFRATSSRSASTAAAYATTTTS